MLKHLINPTILIPQSDSKKHKRMLKPLKQFLITKPQTLTKRPYEIIIAKSTNPDNNKKLSPNIQIITDSPQQQPNRIEQQRHITRHGAVRRSQQQIIQQR